MIQAKFRASPPGSNPLLTLPEEGINMNQENKTLQIGLSHEWTGGRHIAQ